ncbi:MAG: beta-ketoacyl synthase chain length factor [Treponema sp.]|nr:beta-ketoacyl synthase chain length factor [Treponema sp.]
MSEYLNETYITRLSAWAPGVESSGEWDEWALGRRNILSGVKSPELSYTSSTFRRRISQISKMTIQVIHDLLPLGKETKILFFSFRGELAREYQLFKMWMEEGAVSPAAFSLSGFNTPVALASIAFELKGGYSALYPVKNSFNSCVKAAQAALHSGIPDDLVLLYADESIPPECMCFFQDYPTAQTPAAFGLYLSRNAVPLSVPLSILKGEEDNPLAFLKQLLLTGTLRVSS